MSEKEISSEVKSNNNQVKKKNYQRKYRTMATKKNEDATTTLKAEEVSATEIKTGPRAKAEVEKTTKPVSKKRETPVCTPLRGSRVFDILSTILAKRGRDTGR